MTITATNVSIGKKPAPIELTDAAITKLAELIGAEQDADKLALRVAVRPGGCSGYSYDMYFDSEIEEDDIVRTFSGIKVIVDAESAILIEGSKLDYSGGLQGSGFHITNPNATKTCGCGSSFS